MNYMSYNEKSDVWSVGCLLYELCALRPPFMAANRKELASRITTGRFARIPLRYSDDLNTVISTLLTVNVSRCRESAVPSTFSPFAAISLKHSLLQRPFHLSLSNSIELTPPTQPLSKLLFWKHITDRSRSHSEKQNISTGRPTGLFCDGIFQIICFIQPEPTHRLPNLSGIFGAFF